MFTKVTNPRACIHSIPFTTIYKKKRMPLFSPLPFPIGSRFGSIVLVLKKRTRTREQCAGW